MIPYHDENQTQRSPAITIAIIGLNVFAWLMVQGAGAALPLASSVCRFGLIPGALTGMLASGTRFPLGEGMVCMVGDGPAIANVFTSMFLHGSWLHLIGNMWFLWLFGNNIEDSMGRLRFVVFYLACGVAAALGQVTSSPASPIPMVGASGAIGGVMGAYLVLYPRVRVYALVPIGFLLTSVRLPAWLMLVYWFALQLVGGLAAPGDVGGVAFWAHVGGFVAGLALIKVFARAEYISAHRSRQWQPRRVGWR
jgi:membrane associated rhomboid family serine protease